jgi:predicted small secreted protein
MKRKLLLMLVLSSGLLITGCNANVGIGMSVGVPVGNHGYMSIGTGRGRWY